MSFQAFHNYLSNYPSVEAWVYTGVSLFSHHISQHDPSTPPGSLIFQSHRMSCPSQTDGIYLCWKLVIVYLKFKLDWRHSIFITQSGNPTQITLCAFRPACHCHTTLSLRLHSTSPLTLANLAFKNHLKCPFLCKIFPIFSGSLDHPAIFSQLSIKDLQSELTPCLPCWPWALQEHCWVWVSSYLHAWYVGDT